MRETEHGRFQNFDEVDQEFVAREVAKAMTVFAHYIQQDWDEYFAEQDRLDGEVDQPCRGDEQKGPTSISDLSVEPVEGSYPYSVEPKSVGSELAPWEVDGQLGAEGNASSVIRRDDNPKSVAPAPALSTEPTKEKQTTIRLDGTIGSELNYHFNHKNEPRVIFTLDEEDQVHTVYTTKAERVEPIRSLSLLPGDAVHITGVEHQLARMVDGELETRPAVYVWGLKKIEPANQ